MLTVTISEKNKPKQQLSLW